MGVSRGPKPTPPRVAKKLPPKRMTDLFRNGTGGIITVANWIAAPNGATFLYFWAPVWDVTSDATFPVEGFRSTEHWQAIALDKDGNVLMVIPGCQVKSWVRCSKASRGQNVCDLVEQTS